MIGRILCWLGFHIIPEPLDAGQAQTSAHLIAALGIDGRKLRL
jgi:hypothetical protein